MAKGRKAKQAKTKLNMIIYGDTFTGKTTLASQIAYFKRDDGKPFRVLFIDAESGGLDSYLDEMESNGINLDNIYILYTQSLAEVRQYIAKVKNKEDLYELDDEGFETDEIVTDADGEPFRPDALIIEGVPELSGNVEVWSHKDHRIAMMLAIAGAVCKEPIILKDYECVSKSYPHFFEDYKKLGGKFDEWNVGE